MCAKNQLCAGSKGKEKMGLAQTPVDRPAPLPARPRELQDSLNFYLYHPLAQRLAMRLAGTPATPNMVSIIGGLCVVAAALVYTQPGWPVVVFAGLALHMLWHVFDGADGDLARLTKQASQTGEIVDGICDYASHIFLYLTMAWLISPVFGWGGLGLAALAGGSRIIQANHYENRRRQYEFWVYARPWMRSEPLAAQPGLARTLNWIETGYLALAEKMAGKTDDLSKLFAQCEQDARSLSLFQTVAKKHVQPTLGLLSMLGANHRTIVLGLSMLAGSPIYFFMYEFGFLNVVLLIAMSRSERARHAIIADLNEVGGLD
jgi:CDP-alcohol phosphatidyltransferase